MRSSEHPFFSIVVPCCNVARYLDELAASVKGQSFADWECILSYEDSTDGTLSACEALARSDPRFSLVKGPRSGSPATPRNRGLAVAKGEYVVWLDGDDYLADNVLADVAKALASAGESCDLVQGAATEFLEDEQGGRAPVGRHFNFTANDDGKVLSGHDVLVRFASLDYAWPMASFSVCRADFLRTEDLSFRDGLKHEDEEWTPRAVTRARSILVMDRDFYHYRRRALLSEPLPRMLLPAAEGIVGGGAAPHPREGWTRRALESRVSRLAGQASRCGAPDVRRREPCPRPPRSPLFQPLLSPRPLARQEVLV